MRHAKFAGRFYPSDKDSLEKEVKKFLVSEKRENIKAAIVPHAGYAFSGKVAGETFSLLPQKKDFIMLGVNHAGIGKKVCLSLENWQTPLGIVKCNKDLAEKILQKLHKNDIEAEVNEISHSEEHSLEVQLPFLQLTQNKFEIVPIIFANLSYEECIKIVKIIESFVKKNKFLLASSDFTHYGPAYGFVPFPNAKDIYKLDNEIILQILKNESKAFYNFASKSTVCGIYGITILTEIAKLKNWKAKLINYTTSGDITKQWDNVVGYAGIVFG